MNAFKFIVGGVLLGSSIFSVIRQIQSAIEGNREQTYFYWGLTLFLILIHKWVMGDLEE